MKWRRIEMTQKPRNTSGITSQSFKTDFLTPNVNKMVNVYPKKLHWISFQNGFQPEKEHQKLFGKHRKQSSFNCFLDRCEICSLAVRDEREHTLSPRRNTIIFYKHTWQTRLTFGGFCVGKRYRKVTDIETIVSEMVYRSQVRHSKRQQLDTNWAFNDN